MLSKLVALAIQSNAMSSILARIRKFFIISVVGTSATIAVSPPLSLYASGFSQAAFTVHLGEPED
jgi:hypothetical protein